MLAAAALSALGLLLATARAVRAYRAEWRTFVPRTGPVPLPEPALEGLQAVSIPWAGGVLRGWLVPSRNGAAVLFAHGSEGDRRALLPEARLVVAHGYGALLFDFPGHGESPGAVHWSAESRAALRAAAAFLAAQPGVHRAAGYGFSMGGHALAQLASEALPLAALVLAGVPTDGDLLTLEQYRSWGPLTQWPAAWADRRGGFVAAPTPLSKVSTSGLPILVVCGGLDQVVPTRMQEQLSRSGPGPRELLLLPRAGHGDYLQREPEQFSKSLLDFLGRRLPR